jgi:hypothetical protein
MSYETQEYRVLYPLDLDIIPECIFISSSQILGIKGSIAVLGCLILVSPSLTE